MKRRYDPPAKLRNVAGVRMATDDRNDIFWGDKAQLITLGLAPDGMFPGDPGMPLTSVTLWPRDLPPGVRWNAPGRLQLLRAPRGTIRASLAVSEAEQARREAKGQTEREQQEADREAREQFRRAEVSAGASLDVIVKSIGVERVLARLEQMRRVARPRRDCTHLRLVWAAPPRTGAS